MWSDTEVRYHSHTRRACRIGHRTPLQLLFSRLVLWQLYRREGKLANGAHNIRAIDACSKLLLRMVSCVCEWYSNIHIITFANKFLPCSRTTSSHNCSLRRALARLCIFLPLPEHHTSECAYGQFFLAAHAFPHSVYALHTNHTHISTILSLRCRLSPTDTHDLSLSCEGVKATKLPVLYSDRSLSEILRHPSNLDLANGFPDQGCRVRINCLAAVLWRAGGGWQVNLGAAAERLLNDIATTTYVIES
jgi:hypothetical protein